MINLCQLKMQTHLLHIRSVFHQFVDGTHSTVISTVLLSQFGRIIVGVQVETQQQSERKKGSN